MNKTLAALCVLLLCIGFKSFSQNQPTPNRIRLGYLVTSNINFFSTENSTTDFKTDIGWGLGVVSVLNLNQSLTLSLAPTLNFESHTLVDKATNATLQLKDQNLTIPLKLDIKLFKNFSLINGIEYLMVQSKQKEEIKLIRDNFLVSVGVAYALKFKYFTAVPEVSYRIGLNNAIEESALNSYEVRRRAVSIGVKIM
ncbi:hypothetical protein [Pedobacter sp.]